MALRRLRRQQSDSFSSELIDSVVDGDFSQLTDAKSKDINATFGYMKETPLHHAVGRGLQSVTAELIKKKADVNATLLVGDTPLHWAAAKGHIDCAELLLKHGAEINKRNASGWTPLHDAVNNCEAKMVNFLLSKKADLTVTTEDQNTPLHWAAARGDVSICTDLLASNAAINTKNAMDSTPLHLAAQKNHLSTVTLLLNNKADPDIANAHKMLPIDFATDPSIRCMLSSNLESQGVVASGEGWLPIHYAAALGNISAVKSILLATTLDEPTPLDLDSPLHLAARNGHSEMITLLLSKGACVAQKNRYGDTPLHCACARGHVVAAALLSNVARGINEKNQTGETPLYQAVAEGRVGAVALLLDLNASPSIPSATGSYPLHCAAVNGRTDLGILLIGGRANVDDTDAKKKTPLHVAAESGHTSICSYLLKSGANTQLKDSDGRTARTAASSAAVAELFQADSPSTASPSSLSFPDDVFAKSQLSLNTSAYLATDSLALHWAAAQGHVEVITQLLDRGMDVDSLNDQHETPLHWAASKGRMSAISLLVQRGGRVLAQSITGSTPLHEATKKNFPTAIQMLLRCQSDINMVNNDGNTPLHIAAANSFLNCVRTLLNENPILDIRNKQGRTPLHLAAMANSPQSGQTLGTLRALMQAGADQTIEDDTGKLAQQYVNNEESISAFSQSKGIKVPPPSPIRTTTTPPAPAGPLNINCAFGDKSPASRHSPEQLKFDGLAFILDVSKISPMLVPNAWEFESLPKTESSAGKPMLKHSLSFPSLMDGDDRRLSIAQSVIQFLKSLRDSGVLTAEQAMESQYHVSQLTSTRNIWIPTGWEAEAVEDEICRQLVSDTLYNPVESLSSSSKSSFTRTLRNIPFSGTCINDIFPQPSPSPSLAEIESAQSWINWNAFKANEVTEGHVLSDLIIYLFQWWGFPASLGMNIAITRKAMNVLEAKYHKTNPYHNSMHAADVVQACHFLLSAGEIGKMLTPLECMAVLFAAAVHDIDHPGTTNAFEAATFSDLDLRYNDRSILENHHVSTAFKIMWGSRRKGYPPKEEIDMFVSLNAEDRRHFRSLVIELVLGTDMGYSMEIVNRFKADAEAGCLSTIRDNIASGAALDFELPPDERLLLMKMVLKCADISHTSRPLAYHLIWSEAITNEFYNQGDRERALGLPVPAFMDRTARTAEIFAKSQAGFLRHVALPMWAPLMPLLGSKAQEICMIQKMNLLHWDAMSKSEEEQSQQAVFVQEQADDI